MNTTKLITNMEDSINNPPRQQCHFKKNTINVKMQKQCDYSNDPVNDMCE